MSIRYGIIAAMQIEAEHIIAAMEDARCETVGGIKFTLGKIRMANGHAGGEIGEADAVVAVCGIGKVFAAMCAQTMIVTYRPDCIINTGVAGSLSRDIGVGDVVIAEDVVQHDFDTSPFGDPVGLIPTLNVVKMHCSDKLRMSVLRNAAAYALEGTDTKVFTDRVVATGDQFIADSAKKRWIADTFGASACEMEGGAVGQVCTAGGIPFAIVRTISDSADGGAAEDYPAFARRSAAISAKIVIRAVTLIW